MPPPRPPRAAPHPQVGAAGSDCTPPHLRSAKPVVLLLPGLAHCLALPSVTTAHRRPTIDPPGFPAGPGRTYSPRSIVEAAQAAARGTVQPSPEEQPHRRAAPQKSSPTEEQPQVERPPTFQPTGRLLLRIAKAAPGDKVRRPCYICGCRPCCMRLQAVLQMRLQAVLHAVAGRDACSCRPCYICGCRSCCMRLQAVMHAVAGRATYAVAGRAACGCRPCYICGCRPCCMRLQAVLHAVAGCATHGCRCSTRCSTG